MVAEMGPEAGGEAGKQITRQQASPDRPQRFVRGRLADASSRDNMDDAQPAEPAPGLLDRESLREAYEGRVLTIAKICQKHSIARATFYAIRDQEGWKLRNPRRVDKHDLIQRLLRLLQAQIDKLEISMTKSDKDESVVLNKLVTTLDKLISLKEADARQRPARADSKAMAEIRAKVAERLATLRGD